MSNQLTANQILAKYSASAFHTTWDGSLSAMEEYANLRTQALKEENDQLKESLENIKYHHNAYSRDLMVRKGFHMEEIGKELEQTLKGE